MSSTSYGANATGTGSGETQGQDAVNDELQRLQLPDTQAPLYPDKSAFDVYVEHGLIRCEICLRFKPQTADRRVGTVSNLRQTCI